MACSTKTEEPIAAPVIDKEQIKKEIQAKENEYADLYNSRELKSIGYYADDAVTYSQNREPIVGKEAIVNYLKSGLDSMIEDLKISFETREVFVSNDGNQVVEIGYYRLVDSLKDYDFGFWPSLCQSIKKLSPKTGSFEGGFLKKGHRDTPRNNRETHRFTEKNRDTQSDVERKSSKGALYFSYG